MKSSQRTYLLIALGITFLLVLVAPLRLSRELVLAPAWSVSVDDSGAGQVDFDQSLGLEYPGRLVFVDQAGAYRVFPVPSRLARSSTRFALWNPLVPGYDLRSRDGSIIARRPSDSSIPVFTDHGFAAVHRSGSGFTWNDNNGELLWSWSGVYPIIAIVANSQGYVFVLDLTGKLTVLAPDGTESSSWEIPESRVKTGLGMALLSDSLLAIIGGIEPQQIMVVRLSDIGAEPELVWSRRLESAFRRDVLIQALDGGEWLALEQESGLLLLSADGSRSVSIRQAGWIRKIFEHRGLSLLFLLRDAAEGSYLEVWSLEGERLGSLGPATAIHDAGLAGDDMVVVAGPEGLLGLDLRFQ